jgi:hypothetical protein
MLCVQGFESQALVEFAHQDQAAAVGNDAGTLEFILTEALKES